MDRKMFRGERKISSPSTPLISSGEQNFFIFGEIRQCHIVPLRHNDLQVSVLFMYTILIWVKADIISTSLQSKLFT